MDVITLAMAKKYANSLKSGISSAKAEKGKLLLTLENGQTVEVELPVGVSVTNLKIIDNHLKCELSNGEVVDAGELPSSNQIDLYINDEKIEPENGKINLALPYNVVKNGKLGNFKLIKKESPNGNIITLEDSFFNLFDDFENNFPVHWTENGSVWSLLDCTLHMTENNVETSTPVKTDTLDAVNIVYGDGYGACVCFTPASSTSEALKELYIIIKGENLYFSENDGITQDYLDKQLNIDICPKTGKFALLNEELLPTRTRTLSRLIQSNINYSLFMNGMDAIEAPTVGFVANYGTISGDGSAAFNSGVASGEKSFAINDGIASGENSFAIGNKAKAIGTNSFAAGNQSEATGTFASAFGARTQASKSSAAAFGVGTIADNNYGFAIGRYNEAETEKLAKVFTIGNGTPTNRTNALSVLFNGNVSAAGTITSAKAADYAENFEWFDSNIKEEDRVGYFVSLEGNKIKIAQPEDDYILGITSGCPFVLGNGDCDVWNGIYVRDEFNRVITEIVLEPVEEVDKETGKTIVKEIEVTRPKINPEYNNELKYIPRKDRAEWCPVGMLGVLPVRQDGSLRINGYATVGEGGIATAAENGYRVIGIVNENVAKVIFR